MICRQTFLPFKAAALILASVQIQSGLYIVLVATAQDRLSLFLRICACLGAFGTQIPLLAAFLGQHLGRPAEKGEQEHE